MCRILSAIQLPIDQQQRDRLIKRLDDNMLSFTELSNSILQVPVAALTICRAAGEAVRRRDGDVLNLEQACNLLGTQRIGQLLRELPVQPLAEQPLAFRQMLSISEHALTQAQGLFGQRMARLWQELALACLLFMSPSWVLVYQRPELFHEWEEWHLGVNAGKGRAPQQLLGSEQLLNLSQQLVEDWNLPLWIRQGYRSLIDSRRLMVKALHIARDSEHPRDQQMALDADTRLLRWLTRPDNSLLMANGIAVGAHHDWSAQHTLRWQQFIALYLGCTLAEAKTASHEHAVTSAHNQPVQTGLWLPAQALLWPPEARRQPTSLSPSAVGKPGRKQPTDKAAARQPKPPATPPADASVWRHHCVLLNQIPSPFKDLPSLLDSGLLALHQGLGIPACWIALYNGRKQQLVVTAAQQIDELRRLGMELGDARQNSWDWLRNSTCLNLDPQAQQQLSNRLPASLKTLLANQPAHLLPL
ncbi:MAG: HDOD domain-containing protein, partial [Pseudomonadaceae bacterium]